MFFGTTPAIVSQFVHAEIARIKPARVFVPFAGNFVIEQLAAAIDKSIEVHSTDVSLYSLAIGFAAIGRQIPAMLTDEWREHFPMFGQSNDPIEQAAEVIFFADYARNFGKDKHAYYASLNRHARANAERYKQKILGKLRQFVSGLGSFMFYGQDACVILDMVREGDFVFYDPPVLLGDYEKMFGLLENSVYQWQKPEYTVITDELKATHLFELHRRGATVLYRTNNPIEPPHNYENIYRYQYKYHGHYCLYANKRNTSFVGRFTALREDPNTALRLIGKDDVITPLSAVEVRRVSGQIANHYRLLWVKKAEMTDGGIPFLVFVDGKVAGLMQLSSGLMFGIDLISIFSDPAAPTSRYKRLSKLILYLICTEEMLQMFNDMTMWEHTGFTTRVFTNEPVSMKYRGLFELSERTEDKDGFYKYKLMYHSKRLLPSFKDGLLAWLGKDGAVLE